MKSKKIICLVAVLALVMALMAGCGDTSSKDNTPAGGDSTKTEAPKQLTEDEYKAEIQKLETAMSDLSKESAELASLGNDKDKLKAKIKELKEPFITAANLNAPDKYAEAQKKIKSGCEAFADYFDFVSDLMEHPEKATELQKKATDLMTTAQTDFQQGLAMVQ